MAEVPQSKTGMLMDGAFATQAVDSSGEVVHIDGIDVSSMENGEATANSEHIGDKDGKPHTHTVGKVVYVKKILKESDCESDRQREFWRKVGRLPYLYGVVRLYDAAGHDEARAIAAQVRDHVANDESLLVRFSIEGSTLRQDGSDILSSIARRVAMTIKPANKTAVSGLVADPEAPEGFKKHEDPEFRRLGSFDNEVTGASLLKSAGKLPDGSGFFTGTVGKAEDLEKVVEAYDGPWEREKVREFVKANLPEVDEGFLDRFLDLASDFHVKKSEDVDFEDVGRLVMAAESALIDLRKAVSYVVHGPHTEMPDVRKVDLVGPQGKRNPAGRLLISNGQVYHLEDYRGLMDKVHPEGSWDQNMVGVAGPKTTDVGQGRQVETQSLAPPPRPPVFEYRRAGMTRPHTIEFGPHGAALDGQQLDDAEVSLVLRNIHSGAATLRYSGGALSKSEYGDDGVDVTGAMAAVRAAVKAGHLHPDHERAFTKLIYEDPMVRGIGNKRAYQEFRAKNKPGSYVSLDLNDFGVINKKWGDDEGDKAITSAGDALRTASDKVGTGKLFRSGGDEFLAHFPTHEESLRFLRHAREHTEKLPPVQGVHQHSFSAGVGSNFEEANRALRHAKLGKLGLGGMRAHAVGKVPTLVHSLTPGTEGPVQAAESATAKAA